jgi:anti-sigma factor RsiW
MSAEERPYITCRELLDFLYLYLEHELPEDRQGEFDRHLAVCEACRAYLRQYEETIRLGLSAYANPDAPPAADAPEELIQAILKTRKRSGG